MFKNKAILTFNMANDIAQSAYRLQYLARQGLESKVAGLTGQIQNATSLGSTQSSRTIGTILTPDEWNFYLARAGVKGREALIGALEAIARFPILGNYIPDYSAAREASGFALAEERRDQSGLMEQTIPHSGPTKNQKHSEERLYSANQYAYNAYAKSSAYLKSKFKGIKRTYGEVETAVAKAFSKIRSVYQSALGVLRQRRQYEGKNEPLQQNVIELDAYREVRRQRTYPTGQPSSIGKRAA